LIARENVPLDVYRCVPELLLGGWLKVRLSNCEPSAFNTVTISVPVASGQELKLQTRSHVTLTVNWGVDKTPLPLQATTSCPLALTQAVRSCPIGGPPPALT